MCRAEEEDKLYRFWNSTPLILKGLNKVGAFSESFALPAGTCCSGVKYERLGAGVTVGVDIVELGVVLENCWNAADLYMKRKKIVLSLRKVDGQPGIMQLW